MVKMCSVITFLQNSGSARLTCARLLEPLQNAFKPKIEVRVLFENTLKSFEMLFCYAEVQFLPNVLIKTCILLLILEAIRCWAERLLTESLTR